MLLLKMRSGIFSALFLGMLLLGGVGLVMMDWTGSYKATGMSNEVATIDGQPIRTMEFDRFVQRVIRSQNMDARSAYNVGLIDQILELQITDALLNKAAKDYGIVVDDKTVATQVSRMLDQVAKGADKKETLSRLLQNQGMSEAELVNNLRGDMSRRLLTQAVTSSAYIPAAMANDLFAYKNEQRDIEGVLLTPDTVKDIKDPTEDELKSFYEAVKMSYPVPESRSFTVAVIAPDLLGDKVEVSDADVKAYYDDNQEAYEVDERRLLQQSVFDTEAKAAEVIKKATADKKGLEAAVKSVTGDTKAYTGENGFERNGLPDNLATAIFSAKEGDYVGPLKSALGWHVVYVKKIQAAQLEPFDKVKEAIRKEMLHNKAADSIYAATSRIEDRLASGEALEEIAKDVDMSLVPAKDVTLSTKDVAALKSLEKDQESILRTAFGLQDGETSPLADMSDGRMYAVRLDSLKPRRTKSFDEVKSELKARWITEQKNRQNAAYAQNMVEKLDHNAFPLSEVAKAKSVSVKNFSGLTRESKAQGGLTDNNLGMLMSASKGKYLVMPAENGLWIARVKDIKVSKKTPDKKQLDETRDALFKDGSQENLLVLVNELQTRYKTVKNEKLLERMYATDPENQ